MIKKIMLATTLVACSGVMGCLGYQPLYGENNAMFGDVGVGSVSMVKVKRDVGERRTAQLLSQRLRQTFTGGGYTLEVELKEDESSLAVERDASDSRLLLSITANVVVNGEDGEKVFVDEVSASAAYNVEDSPFSTESGRKRARVNATEVLAGKIIHSVALYFNDKRLEKSIDN